MAIIIEIIISIIGLIGFSIGAFITFDNFIYYNSGWFILWTILALFCLLGVIVGLRAKKYNEQESFRQKKIDDAPTLTESVTVISKLHEKSVGGMAGIVETEHLYYVVFGFPDKHREKFVVDKKQYALVREGEIGDFSYKQLESGVLFVDFQPHN